MGVSCFMKPEDCRLWEIWMDVEVHQAEDEFYDEEKKLSSRLRLWLKLAEVDKWTLRRTCSEHQIKSKNPDVSKLVGGSISHKPTGGCGGQMWFHKINNNFMKVWSWAIITIITAITTIEVTTSLVILISDSRHSQAKTRRMFYKYGDICTSLA